MRFSANSLLIATAYLAINTHALPRPAVSYSVVNVDGGSQTPPSVPTTVYQTITESSGSKSTVSITIVETPSSTPVISVPTTIFHTEHGAATETALIPEVSLPVVPHSSSADPPSPTGKDPEFHVPIPDPPAPTPVSPESVVTVVSVTTATPTTSYYDNGMWHTSYAIKNVDNGQWTPSYSPTGYATYGAGGTGARLAGRAAPTGYGSMGWYPTGYRRSPHLGGRALPTGYGGWGWNSTGY